MPHCWKSHVAAQLFSCRFLTNHSLIVLSYGVTSDVITSCIEIDEPLINSLRNGAKMMSHIIIMANVGRFHAKTAISK